MRPAIVLASASRGTTGRVQPASATARMSGSRLMPIGASYNFGIAASSRLPSSGAPTRITVERGHGDSETSIRTGVVALRSSEIRKKLSNGPKLIKHGTGIRADDDLNAAFHC